MKFALGALVLALTCGLADARDMRVPTAEQAARNLKAAEKSMNEALARLLDRQSEEKKVSLLADQMAWQKRVQAGCAPDDTGGNSGSAAARQAAIEDQCTADATKDRAALIRDALK